MDSQQKIRSLVGNVYTTFREEESLDYLSDSLLYDVCYQFVVQNTNMSFEDFLEYYFEEA